MRATDAVWLVFTLLLAWSFYRAHRDPNFRLDLFDLVMADGRLSRIAVAFMVTLGATTWIMVRLTLDGKLTEGFFTAYALAWIAPVVARLFSTPPASGTVVTDTKDTSSKTVTTTLDAP